MMDPEIITVVAAVVGAALGGVASFITAHVTQRRQFQREYLARELGGREVLYGEFVKKAADLFLDSIDKNLDDPAGMVELITILARIRLSASPQVTKAGEHVMDAIIASYRNPSWDKKDLFNQAREEFIEPMEAFTLACQWERTDIMRRL